MKIIALSNVFLFAGFFACLCWSCEPGPEDPSGGLQIVARVPEKVWSNQKRIVIDATNSSVPGVQTKLSFQWSWMAVPSGTRTPGIFFSNAAKAEIDSMPFPGVYILQLKVTGDGGISRSKDFRMEVLPDSLLQYPAKADAGDDQTVMLPRVLLNLDGSGSEQINPAGRSLAYSWTRISYPLGSREPYIESPTSSNTTVTGLTAEGDYVFALKVTNEAGSFDMDTVVITVLPDKMKGESVEFTVQWMEGLKYFYGFTNDDVGILIWEPDIIIPERKDYMEVRVWDEQKNQWHDPGKYQWILQDDGWGGVLLLVLQTPSSDPVAYYSVVGKETKVRVSYN